MEFLFDVGVIRQGGDIQYGAPNLAVVTCDLASVNVSHFVGENAGQFVFVVGRGKQFLSNVDPASGECESIGVGQIDQRELGSDAGFRCVGGEAVSDAQERCAERIVLEHAVGGIRAAGEDVAEKRLLG